MARGSSQATNAATSAGNLSNQLEGNASMGFNALMPELQTEITNPQGFTAPTIAKMKTSNMQTAGGTQAGATGQGALLAARTKNPGTAAAAIAKSARTGGEQLSQANLKTDLANEQLKERQREAGMTGLENLTGLETTAGIQSAGQIAPDVNANTNAGNSSWDWARFILDPAMAGAAQGAGAAMH